MVHAMASVFRKRSLTDSEWNRAKSVNPPGTRVSAVVRKHVGLGALCEVGAGRIPAVMRNIEIDWDPTKQNASTVPEGTYFDACVVAYEDVRRELIISRKAAETTPFDQYVSAHRVGDIVDGVIHELTPNVVVVRLTGGLQGEIPLERVPKLPEPPEDELHTPWSLAKGDCLKSTIIAFDQPRRRVVLDLAAAVKKLDAVRQSTLDKWRVGQAAELDLRENLDSVTQSLAQRTAKGQLTVLIVDDEPDITYPFKAALKDRGHHVMRAAFVAEAEPLIANAKQIDVAVIDQQLKDGMGVDLLRRVAAKFPHSRRVLLTGNPGVLTNGVVDQFQVVAKPITTQQFVSIVEGDDETSSTERMWAGEESIGSLAQLSSTEVDRLSQSIRQVFDNYLGALREPFGVAKVAILRLQKSTNSVQCVRAFDLKPSSIQEYSDSLRFSFVGDVLLGNAGGFFRLNRPGLTSEEREPLRPLLQDLNTIAIYGMPLKVESQANPMGVFAFLPENYDLVSPAGVRDFRQTVTAMSLAIERASLDAQLFRNQRVLVAGSILLGMTHEIRNEVQSLTSMTDYLVALNNTTYADAGDSRNRQVKTVDVLESLQKHTSHLRQLLDSALGLTRTTKSELIPLRYILGDSVEKCRSMAEKDNVYLHFDLAECAELEMPVSSALRQVIMNLLLNAIQHVRIFRKHESGFVTLSVRRRSIDQTPEFAIRVEDNAFGLDWNNRKQIFEPFFTTRSHGTGLGLYVARMISESLGGQLEVESSLKYLGTTMLLRLPIVG